MEIEIKYLDMFERHSLGIFIDERAWYRFIALDKYASHPLTIYQVIYRHDADDPPNNNDWSHHPLYVAGGIEDALDLELIAKAGKMMLDKQEAA